jgi:site-specific DNA-methyltransferase (adenine-specific)
MEVSTHQYLVLEGRMNTDLMFSSKTDLRATPQDFYDQLNNEFEFTLDPCATDENHKCGKYYTIKED